jgi:hypothetical protein
MVPYASTSTAASGFPSDDGALGLSRAAASDPRGGFGGTPPMAGLQDPNGTDEV